jgi:putative membrane protein (TIGR04086 family)
MRFADLRWGRVIVGGVAAELAVFAIVFPIYHFFGQRAFLASILVATFVLPFVAALWVGRSLQSDFLLHGALVGVVAALVYLIVSRGQPEPLLYKVSHGLKIVGGLLGGVVARGLAHHRAGQLQA